MGPVSALFAVIPWVSFISDYPFNFYSLMMKPAQITENENEDKSGDAVGSSSPTISVLWDGDVELDWRRVRRILKDVETDGRRIAMWRRWLSSPSQRSHATSEEDREIPDTSDKHYSTAHPSLLARKDRDCARAVLNAHVCFLAPLLQRSKLSEL